MNVPELKLSVTVGEALRALAARESLESLEAQALESTQRQALTGQLASADWWAFVVGLGRFWSNRDHVIVRDVPIVGDGATTLLLALAFDAAFKPYRRDKIVKHFRMSPWTTELSQTMRECHFHTDLSTAIEPPCVTLIHCRKADPTPGRGVIRVAPVRQLLAELRQRGAEEALRFMLSDTVGMVDERARAFWSGVIASESSVRFHPETLRAAERRGAHFADSLEHQLEVIHDAAMAASEPIELGSGDALFVSNIRALHYRGACTVQYLEFPRSFEAREIHILHLRDEPTWPE